MGEENQVMEEENTPEPENPNPETPIEPENPDIETPPEPTYEIPIEPIYNGTIRKLQNTDPANAETILNPLFQQLIENTAAVRDEAEKHIVSEQAHTELFEHKVNEETFTNHANDFSIHVNSQTMEQYNQGLTELEQHVNDSAIHVTQEKQDFWNAGAQTAEEAKGKSQEAMIKANENEQRILTLEKSLYSNVTQNPFSVAFDGLSGVQVIKGVWNQSKQRIEC